MSYIATIQSLLYRKETIPTYLKLLLSIYLFPFAFVVFVFEFIAVGTVHARFILCTIIELILHYLVLLNIIKHCEIELEYNFNTVIQWHA